MFHRNHYGHGTNSSNQFRNNGSRWGDTGEPLPIRRPSSPPSRYIRPAPPKDVGLARQERDVRAHGEMQRQASAFQKFGPKKAYDPKDDAIKFSNAYKDLITKKKQELQELSVESARLKGVMEQHNINMVTYSQYFDRIPGFDKTMLKMRSEGVHMQNKVKINAAKMEVLRDTVSRFENYERPGHPRTQSRNIPQYHPYHHSRNMHLKP
jgi:hypothetical protein